MYDSDVYKSVFAFNIYKIHSLFYLLNVFLRTPPRAIVFKFIEPKEILPVVMFLILKSEMVSRYLYIERVKKLR